MAIEPKRACGYRKVGATYLVGPLGDEKCHLLPVKLGICPTCNTGIKQTRGWTWVDPLGLWDSKWSNKYECAGEGYSANHCDDCPLCNLDNFNGDKAGLLWVGENFYENPKDFLKEAVELGVSKRISAVPNGFIAGMDYVLLAHPSAIEGNNPPNYVDPKPGIFLLWKPARIEKIITETMSKNEKLMETLTNRGICPVIVPDDDPDHNPGRIEK